MKRWLVLPPLFLLGLFVALHATAAVKDANANVKLEPLAASEYRLGVENSGSDVITSVVFTAGPALTVSSVDSSSVGSCSMTSASSFSCSVSLAPPPCACQPGDNVNVFFHAAGDPAGSSVQLNGAKTIVVGGTTTQTTTTQPTTTASTQPTTTKAKTTPPKKKKLAKCKKGQKSTKKKPCRRA